MKDENGKEYTINDSGEKQELILDDFGNKCILKDGMIQIFKTQFRKKSKSQVQQVFVSDDGQKFIKDKEGNVMYIHVNENGQEYFENSKGQKQLFVPDPAVSPLIVD